MPYVAIQQMLDAANPPGMRNYWTSDFCTLPDEACEVVRRVANSHTLAAVAVPHGRRRWAVARVDDDAMAFGQRQAPFNIHLLNMWADPADDAERDRVAEGLRRPDEAVDACQGAYLNYLGDEGAGTRPGGLRRRKFERLQALKDRYDPENLFRHNQNIPPSAGTG